MPPELRLVAPDEDHLPTAIEAEQAVLGSCMIDNRAIARIVGLVTPEDFYLPGHATIFRAMRALHDSGMPPDLVTLVDHLGHETLDGIGGAAYLVSIAASVPTAMNVEYYARLLPPKAILRSEIEIGNRIQESAYSPTANPEAIIARAIDDLRSLPVGRLRTGDDEGERAMAHLERLLAPPEAMDDRLLTGLVDLDRKLNGGFRRTELVLIGARTSVGKSALTGQIAYAAAVLGGYPTAFFSLEMGWEQVRERMYSIHTGIPHRRLTSNTLDAREQRLLSDAVGMFHEAPLTIIQADPTWTIERIHAESLRIHSRYSQGLRLVVIDYLQLVRSGRRYDARYQEVGAVSRGAKAIAMDPQIRPTLLAPAQLNRDAIGDPRLEHLREAGDLEQDADGVLLLSRDTGDPNPSVVQESTIDVAKRRDGETGKVRVGFRSAFMQFVDWAGTRYGSST